MTTEGSFPAAVCCCKGCIEHQSCVDEMLDNVYTDIPSLHKFNKHFQMQEWMMTEGAFPTAVIEGALSINHVSVIVAKESGVDDASSAATKLDGSDVVYLVTAETTKSTKTRREWISYVDNNKLVYLFIINKKH